MKKQKKYALIAGTATVVALGVVCVGGLLLKEKAESGDTNYVMLRKNTGLTEEEKAKKTQEYLENSVEEALRGREFASEEEKEQYRQILMESVGE